MGNSPLDFPSTESFRVKLNRRNLAPYPKSPNRAQPPINYEVVLRDYAVVDSPDVLIDEPILANELYSLNRYGQDGGYDIVADPNRILNTQSNLGEYGYQDANIIQEAPYEANKPGGWKVLNAYGDGTTGISDSAVDISRLDILVINQGRTGNSQPYPTTFVPSSYTPLSILLSDAPSGTNGSLSQDSFIARLGAKVLRKEFQDRVARQLLRQTIGRANILNPNSGTGVLGVITGSVPLLEPNYSITIPSNPITASAQFALSLAGSYIPVSPIPGSYFDSSINAGQPTTLQQITNAFTNTGVGNFLSSLLGPPKNGSQLFLNNTGAGQKSLLFKNLDYNKFKPGYERNFIDRLGGVLFGTSANNSNYYIGSTSSEPSRVFSPSNDLPVDEFNREIQSPVYGPSEMAQLYEGPSQSIKLGANGPTYSDGGGIEGGFTWVSPKYKGNAGYKVGVGGENIKQDSDFKEASYNSTESTNFEFKGGSILDDTQRIIKSQPSGGRRLKHVGNAMDQVSKVFNDGYKELTKGSRVLSYVGDIGQEKGAEYCRVFAKDTPYLQYNDLQKTDGITTEGRRFSYSVFDKTYNLNMYPNKQEGGQDSTNLIGGGENGYAKKYMFSIENLSWRTSNKPGYTWADLPICERGPNHGRVMWFPPYGLTFTEGSSASWKSTDFIGRPEPIYTYSNTNRTGTLSWKIVVDHPSALNVIVNKVLNNETNKTRVDSILESFFAGCRKYDLYDLAKKYYMIKTSDLTQIQTELNNKTLSTEQIKYVDKTVNNGGQVVKTPEVEPTNPFTKYEQLGFYFDNDIPKKDSTVTSFDDYYTPYIGEKTVYINNNAITGQFFSDIIENNFQELINLANDLVNEYTKNPNILVTIRLVGSASAPATKTYNVALSQRRIDSVRNWFKTYPILSQAIGPDNNGNLKIMGSPQGEQTVVTPRGQKVFNTYTCSDQDNKSTLSHEIYTINAMACRRVAIASIEAKIGGVPASESKTPDNFVTTTTGTVEKGTKTVTEEVQRTVLRDNITKRVLRSLLSECDYFETIKEETPLVFDNLKDKLKFFHPSFHSMTPEGLNSRLTFLQQCMRPGDTIPVVKTIDGKDQLEYNNATNTAFGAPPVLVLRVGDFYNTKIIPDNLSLTYESLDINPEGIGIQPMIANVTLTFKFVGGSGLKEAVDKIQNGLSFNFYANTEIYDDRADVTDDSYKVLDKNFLDAIGFEVPPPTVNQATNDNGQNNNNTIGTIKTKNPTQTGETGTIIYKDFMVYLVNSSQEYFQNIINKSKEVNTQYNNAVLQVWSSERKYVDGYFQLDITNKVKLFGKPNDVDKKVDKIIKKFADDIDSNNEYLIKWIDSRNFTSKVKRKLKDNYINYINTKKNTFTTGLNTITQNIVLQEQNYISKIARANVITFGRLAESRTDGLQQKNGFVVVYITTPTNKVTDKTKANTLDELEDDIRIIRTSINDYYDKINNPQTFISDSQNYSGILTYGGSNSKIISGNVFNPFTDGFSDVSLQRSYFLLSNDILDSKKYQIFKQSLIGDIINNPSIIGNQRTDLEQQFDECWNTVKPIFEKENKVTNDFLSEMEKNYLKDFVKYTPFNTAKEYEFDYTVYSKDVTPIEKPLEKPRKEYIESLGYSTNKNTNDEWSSETTVSGHKIIISKVKLN